MRSKVVTKEEALTKFKDGQTIMFGDWHGQLTADELIDGILEMGVKDIDAIAVSAGTPEQGIGKLIAAHRVKSLATTHIAFNPLARDQMFAGELDIEFVPQGTFAERIRCGGAGLGGCLTPTGIGTDVEIGKEKLTINGKEYLLELPMHADISLIRAWKADTAGNIVFRKIARATNNYMAYAADFVIVEAEELVELGELAPDEIDVAAPIIDMVYIRTGEKKPFCLAWQKAKAKAEAKAAEKLKDKSETKTSEEPTDKSEAKIEKELTDKSKTKTAEESTDKPEDKATEKNKLNTGEGRNE